MVADVARHFWSCVPEDTLEKRQKVRTPLAARCLGGCNVGWVHWHCARSQASAVCAQAERLASHVDCKLWPELDHAIATANRMGGPQRPYVRQLLTPALRMMEVMLERCGAGGGVGGVEQQRLMRACTCLWQAPARPKPFTHAPCAAQAQAGGGAGAGAGRPGGKAALGVCRFCFWLC